jgi:putative acyl-CoA dehydrogenase
VSCLFVPRFRPDGSQNNFFIQRLKDKCGNRSNASSEIEYRDTWSMLVGEEGRGIREILSHAHLTRLDFAVGSAGLMRQALTLAMNHARHATAFGKPHGRPADAMNVLADLAIDSEAAMLGALRVARATDSMETNEHERLLSRVATPAIKYWNCQRATLFVYEACRRSRRQRLHHGEPGRPAIPRGAAQFDLGRHDEHDVHGRAAPCRRRRTARCR